MKKQLMIVLTAVLIAALAAPAAWAAPLSAAQAKQLLSELRAMKQRVKALEDRLAQAERCSLEAQKQAQEARAMAREGVTGSLKLSAELAKVKQAQPAPGVSCDDGKKLKLYGAIEMEAAWQRLKAAQGQTRDSSDLTLATAELFVEAQVNPLVSGVLHFLYEQGDDEAVTLDEAFILVGRTGDMPWYFLGGRMYPAVGLFESFMVSDPITKSVFESRQTAAEAGYANNWGNVSLGVFRSDLQEDSQADEPLINSYYARIQASLPEGALSGWRLRMGLAYTNNLSASGFFGDHLPDTISGLVGGWSVMAEVGYGPLTLTGEYLGATDSFAAGSLDFAPAGAQPKPHAYNLELAWEVSRLWTLAARYEGSGDLYGQAPERQYGLAASWSLLADTVLSLEYLRGEYEDGSERDLITSQIAVSF